jgi:hypothetical protein
MNMPPRFSPRRILLHIACLSCLLALAGCGLMKGDPQDAMKAFCTLIKEGHYKEAFHKSAFWLQSQQDAVSFEAVARDFNLGDFAACDWRVVSETSKEAHLMGEIPGDNGENTRLTATLIPETGKWRVYAVTISSVKYADHPLDIFNREGRGVTFGEAFARQIPDEAETRALVSETMQRFNEGLHEKDFTAFYKTTSQLWQSQATLGQVSRAFKGFTDENVTLDDIKNIKMVFEEPPRLTSEGALLVKGYYPTQPNRVVFTVKYTFELPKWKLLGITVSIKP